ncbi:protein of unknown function [Paraburkholderia dioscoreae]|uniref:Uncharacterized protein n=1 Tax=Paraburkholderia dioscoreae TaxID=2604047 RepID=A0A5Q4Z6V7_9BURK|nr:protein of unknown function [Paraburkholderia dioscoreae]
MMPRRAASERGGSGMVEAGLVESMLAMSVVSLLVRLASNRIASAASFSQFIRRRSCRQGAKR